MRWNTTCHYAAWVTCENKFSSNYIMTRGVSLGVLSTQKISSLQAIEVTGVELEVISRAHYACIWQSACKYASTISPTTKNKKYNKDLTLWNNSPQKRLETVAVEKGNI